METCKSFVNKERIENLRNIVRKNLGPLINDDFVLLDVPNHRNIGDLLIWEGELEFLKEIPHKLNYSCNIFTYRENKIMPKDVILLHGGGNFGDVWRLNQDFRNSIIEKFHNNRIIVFPQTVHYSGGNDFIEKDAQLFNSHPDLTICVRDKISYDFAKVHFNRCNILLLPDMAFFLNFESFQGLKKTDKTLILKRLDKELGSDKPIAKIKSFLDQSNALTEIKDWPGFIESGTFMRKIQYYLIKMEIILSKKMINSSFFNAFVDDDHGLKGKNYKNNLIKKGIEFINNYDTVYSTRLHGFILSVLLNKKVFIFDNSYGKNKNYFDTWLSDFENVKLIVEE